MGDFLKEVLSNVDMSKVNDGGIGSFLAKAIQGFTKPKDEQLPKQLQSANPNQQPVAQPGQINVLQSLGQ